jgi:hypothetical protein
MNKHAIAVATFMMMFPLAQTSHAENMLKGGEIKALISGKTVDVSVSGGPKWRQYFSPDGSSARSNGETSQWSIEEDKHCNTTAKTRCAAIRANGDGTFARLKADGSTAATWSKIVDGKDF